MLSLTVLASGSQGNCAVLLVGGESAATGGAAPAARLLVIDAGLSPRATRERLVTALRRRPEEATDLFLTHLDADHFREGWIRLLHRHPIRVRLHPSHIREAILAGIPESSIDPLESACRVALDDGATLAIEPVRLPHDDRGTTGFVFEWSRGDDVVRIGYATDLGRVPEPLHGAFHDLDVLAFESNYDPLLQLASARPDFLKRRIMGGRGHLSNEQSLEAVLRISRASAELKAIVLLHLSQQCNRADLVERLWQSRAPELSQRVILSSQFAPTNTVRATPRARRRREIAELLLFADALA